MNSSPISVSELTRTIKFQLETKFSSVEVQGEVSNFKRQSSGHLYFNLKDPEAQISVVMFKGDADRLRKIPKDGDEVTLKGALNVYPPSGKYQIVAKDLVYSGLGALLIKLEELKIKLLRLGYFKADRKKPLPKFPKTIGVITSPTGAVLQDILNVLSRRHKGFHLILNPVKVQGIGSAQEIAQAIEEMNRYSVADVLIIARGGGSIEDLWSFNEEIVAHAIFKSTIPIISAVGHETDHTIADYVADLRAPTPSAAAEIVLQESAQLLHHFLQLQNRLEQALTAHIKHEKQRLSSFLKLPLFQTPYALIGFWLQKHDQIKEGLDASIRSRLVTYKLKLELTHKRAEALKPLTQITHLKSRLHVLERNIKHSFENHLKQKKYKLFKIEEILKAIDPKNLLTKGYSILFSEKEGSVIKSIRSLNEKENIRILLSDGEATSQISKIYDRR